MDEFLTLRFSDAVFDGNKVSWNITPTNYREQNSSICFVSLERCNISFLGNSGTNFYQGDTSTIIQTTLGVQNQQITDNRLPVLDIVKTNTRAIITEITTQSAGGADTVAYNALDLHQVATKYSNPDPMRLLIAARPTAISLIITHEDLVSLAVNQDINYVMLRFAHGETP